jgi:hypothetical protein
MSSNLRALVRRPLCTSDAILDRILHRSHRIHFEAKESIRKTEAEEEFASPEDPQASAADAANHAWSYITQQCSAGRARKTPEDTSMSTDRDRGV